MSNLMHKVKDALTGHNDHKGSSHDSSDQNIEHNQGQYNSSAMGSEARDTFGTNPQDSSIQNPRMSTDNDMNTGDSATRNTGDYGSGGHGAGGFGPDSKKSDLNNNLDSYRMGATENHGPGRYESGTNRNSSGMDTMRGTANTYGSNTTGTTGAMGSHGAAGPDTGAYQDYTRDTRGLGSSDRPSAGYDPVMGTGNSKPDAATYNSSYAGGYGSSELNTGQRGASTMEYGASGMGDKNNDTNLGGSHGYNTRSNAGSNMDNPMEPRGESELNNRTNQQGFGGTAAAGGSSSNTRRRSSGPHSSNLLNKLDPRVRSSDYENQSASGQQRGW